METNDGRILVVDDEEAIRSLLCEVLEDEGYRPISVDSGQAALRSLRPGIFDLLITDIMMPGMNGIELVREVQKLDPNIIPLVMTGFATLETAMAAVKEGAYDYVTKPFNLSELKVAVSNAFEKKRLREELTRLKELSELFRLSEAMVSIRSEKEVVALVLETALSKVGADQGSVMLLDHSTEKLTIAASVGLPEEIARTAVVKLGQGISGWVAKAARPVLVTDVEEHPLFKSVAQRHTDKSFVSVPLESRQESMAVPVKTSGEVLGVLNVSNKHDGSIFSEADLKFLSILANQAAISLKNCKLFQSLQESYLMTVQSLALLLEARDAYTKGHSERVTAYSQKLGKELKLSNDELKMMHNATTLHDVGKIGIPDAVLNKVEKLTDVEWAMIKEHPMIGYNVLAPVKFLEKERMVVRHHHEREDGRGYPDGLPGAEMAIVEKISVVADAYDAMASDRAYRKALSRDKILAELDKNRGSQFDSTVVDALVKLLNSGGL